MADFHYRLPNGNVMVVDKAMTPEDALQLAANSGAITAEEAFPQRDLGEQVTAAQQQVFEDLNPLEKLAVGFRGSTRSISGGLGEDIPQGEREAIDVAESNIGINTLGELVPNLVAPGRVLAQSAAEGVIEGLQAPEGERFSTGVSAFGQSLVAGKVVEKGLQFGGKVVDKGREMVARSGRQRVVDDAPVIADTDLITASRSKPSPGQREDEILAELEQKFGGEVSRVDEQAGERFRLSERADDLGIRVTPGQRSGNVERRQLENSLASNPATSGPFNDVATDNSVRYAQLANRAIGEQGDALLPATFDRATERLGRTFGDVSNRLDEALPGAFADGEVSTEFLNRIDTAARQEIGDIRNQSLNRTEINEGGFRGEIESIDENLKVAPMVDLIRFKMQEGQLSAKELMGIRSSLVDEMRLSKTGQGGAAQGTQVRAMGDIVDAIDNLIVDAAEKGDVGELASDYAVARAQWRTLQALENSNSNTNLGEVSARRLDTVLRKEYPQEYRRGGLTGANPGERSENVQALADFFDATRIGSNVTNDIVGNSGTATRQFFQQAINDPGGLLRIAGQKAVGEPLSRGALRAPSLPANRQIPAGALRPVTAAAGSGAEGNETVQIAAEQFAEMMRNLGFGN